jgi:integration host factor subunit beta
MPTVTKKDLIDRMAEVSGYTRVDVKDIVQCFLDQVIEELARGNRLEFRDFGVLETKDRAARVAQNPKTLERVNVPPKRTVKFKVGRLLKDKLDKYASSPPPPRGKPQVVVKAKIARKALAKGKSAG